LFSISCENSSNLIADGDKIPCKFQGCNKRLVIKNMRQHVGKHILTDLSIAGINTCGFCGQSNTCTIRLDHNPNTHIETPISPIIVLIFISLACWLIAKNMLHLIRVMGFNTHNSG